MRKIVIEVPDECCSEDGKDRYCKYIEIYCMDNSYRYCKLFREVIGGTNNLPCPACLSATVKEGGER